MFLKISEQDWNNVKKAFNDLAVPLAAHQAMANIFQAIETQCKVNETDIRTSDSPSL